MLLSYLPNRRWVNREGKGSWTYYGALHEYDLSWTGRVYEREQLTHGGKALLQDMATTLHGASSNVVQESEEVKR